MPEETNIIRPPGPTVLMRFNDALNTMFQRVMLPNGGCITITPDSGVIVSPGTSADEVKLVVAKIREVSENNSEQRRVIDRYLGQLICNYAALTNTDWTEAIEMLDLVDTTGRAYKTLMKLPRMVSLLPDEAYALPRLTTSHYDAATSFAGPSDPEIMARFNEGRMRILTEASLEPEERGKGWVTSEMRKLQQEFGIVPARRAPVSDIRKAFEVCSQALLEWQDEDYAAFGVTRGQMRDRWEGYKADLIDRGILTDNSSDPITFTLPWRQNNETAITVGTETEVAGDEA